MTAFAAGSPGAESAVKIEGIVDEAGQDISASFELGELDKATQETGKNKVEAGYSPFWFELSEKEGPYLVHCTEGKDRAGFTIMLLEALMGAQLQEIIDDYMLSFYNYYGISKDNEPERYEAVLNNNLLGMLYHVTGADSMETLEKIDLESAVTNYLLQHGMTENEILTLKDKLR